MIDIIVQRGDGKSPGPDIQSPLINTLEVALARGRNEIDSHSGLEEVEIESVIKPDYERGGLVEVHDALQGASWRGKIDGISHRVSAAGAYTVFKVMRKP